MTGAQNVSRASSSNIILLTGGRGAGKTSLCREAVAWAGTRGWQVAGLLSPARFDGPDKVGIEVMDLGSGRSQPLAILRSQAPGAAHTFTQHWVFDEGAVAWGNDVLRQAVPCDLLIVDELGPLELERGEGWTEGPAAVDSYAYRWALVMIRPELLPLALDRWPQAVVLDVTGLAAARKHLRKLLVGDAA